MIKRYGTAEKIKAVTPGSLYQAWQNLLKTAEFEIVYIGDSEPDIAVARNAGAECIAVSWGYRSREQLVTAGAVTIIDHPHELLEILK